MLDAADSVDSFGSFAGAEGLEQGRIKVSSRARVSGARLGSDAVDIPGKSL